MGQDIPRNAHSSSSKVPVISNLMKIRLVRAELTNGQTDTTKLIVAFAILRRRPKRISSLNPEPN